MRKNDLKSNAKPRDIVEIKGIPFYIIAELKEKDYNFVELANLDDASIMFAARDGDIIIPVSDEKLIISLAAEMSAEAKDNSKLLLKASKLALSLIDDDQE